MSAPEGTIYALPDGEPLDFLEVLPAWDGKAYLDERRDAYLETESERLDALMSELEGLTKRDLLHLARLAFVAGARAKADEVMCAAQADFERAEQEILRRTRRVAMLHEAERQEREAEWPEWARGLRLVDAERR